MLFAHHGGLHTYCAEKNKKGRNLSVCGKHSLVDFSEVRQMIQ
jgi:hypothetical protein